MKRKLVCYYDTEKYYNLNRLSNVVLTNDGYDLRFIYALLNSTLMDFYFNKFFNEYEVKPLHLSRLPIKITPIENQVSFKKIIEELLILNGDKQGRIKVFLGRVKSNFDQVVINKKIESFYRHDFQLVVAELKKQKISIPLAEQDEWEKYFNTYKTEINELQDQITRKDAMLDRMIYDLYGLNDDEIKTVERAAL